MQRQLLSVSVFLVGLLCGSGFGQSYELELGTADGVFGEEVSIPLTLSTDAEVQAVQAVFDWEASAGTAVDLLVDPAVEEAAEFVLSHVDANWVAIGIVRSGTPLTGEDIALGTAIIRCASGPDVAETPIVFRDDLYSASSETLILSNVVTVNGTSVRKEDGLVLTSGNLRCGPTESFALRLGAGGGQHGGPVEIPLTLSTDAEVQGVQAVFDWEASAGTGQELIVDPAVDAAADLVLTHIDASWMSLGITSVLNPLTGDNVPLAIAVIRCGAGPDVVESPIVFRNGVYSAPESPLVLSNAVTVRGASRLEEDGLELTNGSFRCTGREVCDDGADNDGDGLVDCEDSDCGSGIDVSPPALDFGEVAVGGSTELTVTISSAGDCDLTVSAVELTAETSGDFSVTEVGGPVAPGDSLSAVVTYAPSSVGAASGVLRIASDAAGEPAVEVTLSGSGIVDQPPGVPQLAGDCSQDGALNLADVICMVKIAFPGFNLLDRTPQVPPCATDEGTVAVLDVNADGQLNGSDMALLADFLFVGGAPPAQGMECFGVDEALGCSQGSACP